LFDALELSRAPCRRVYDLAKPFFAHPVLQPILKFQKFESSPFVIVQPDPLKNIIKRGFRQQRLADDPTQASPEYSRKSFVQAKFAVGQIVLLILQLRRLCILNDIFRRTYSDACGFKTSNAQARVCKTAPRVRKLKANDGFKEIFSSTIEVP
jgi:hypothetical protein